MTAGFQELRDLGVSFRPFEGIPPRDVGRPSPFDAPWSRTVDLLADELRHLSARDIVIELALQEGDLRLDGIPRANARLERDGARISFQSKWGPLRYETSEFTHNGYRGLTGWQANLRAIALAMEALRKVDRYGVSKRGEQYAGWRAIPMTTGPSTALASRQDAEEYLMRWGGDWRRAARETHPDVGGDAEEFQTVMRAKELVGS